MKELKLDVQMDFSEVAIEDAIIRIRNEVHKELCLLDLNVSVFDAKQAVRMMVENNDVITHVHITPELVSGEWSIVDNLNDVFIRSSVLKDMKDNT